MLPTALRSFRVSSFLARSESLAPAAIELLCDPLQRLVHPSNVIYCAQERSIHCTCEYTQLAKSVIQPNRNKAAGARHNTTEQLATLLPVPAARCYSDQPAVRSDDVIVYEGPLKKAVHSLKVRAVHARRASPPSDISDVMHCTCFTSEQTIS